MFDLNLCMAVIITLYLHNLTKFCEADADEKRKVLVVTSLKGLVQGKLLERCRTINLERMRQLRKKWRS